MRGCARVAIGCLILGLAGCYLWSRGPLYVIPTCSVAVIEPYHDTPVVGAIVAALWVESSPNLEGESERHALRVAEALTDQNGVASFPRQVGGFHFSWHSLSPRSPQILVFKEGQVYLGPWNGKQLLKAAESTAELNDHTAHIAEIFCRWNEWYQADLTSLALSRRLMARAIPKLPEAQRVVLAQRQSCFR